MGNSALRHVKVICLSEHNNLRKGTRIGAPGVNAELISDLFDIANLEIYQPYTCYGLDLQHSPWGRSQPAVCNLRELIDAPRQPERNDVASNILHLQQ